MLVGREGAKPTEKDLLELAASVDLKRPRPIIEDVKDAVAEFLRYADEARVPKKVRDKVAVVIGARTPRSVRSARR